MVEREKDKLSQNIVLENREKLSVSGVDDVNSFDDKQITAFTSLGFLTVKGSDLHIKKFNVQTKELSILGKVSELLYSSNKKRNNSNFFGKIFK